MLALIVLAGRAFATDPLTDAVASMKATANSSYAGADPVQDTGVPSRLRTSTFTARLGQAQGLLQAAGCTVDADLFLSGAYRSNAVSGTTGESESGTLLDATLSTEPKAIIGNLKTTPVNN
ncbi:MAG: hypothetical protein KC656_31120, partial [Myxococcales bacterium]|nr:hypothetical protein [Myxococcales bacterium]